MSAEEPKNDIVSTILNEINSDTGQNNENTATKNDKPLVNNKSKKKKAITTIKITPKSGRFWKTSKDKFSTINKTKGLKQSFEKKAALRRELERVKELSKQVKVQKKEELENKKERRRENLKRTEENRKKSEIVQVITNTAKIKRLRKKQLRFIEKRDTNPVVNNNK